LNIIEGVAENFVEEINIFVPCSNLESNNLFQAPLNFCFCSGKVIGNLLVLDLLLCQQTSNASSSQSFKIGVGYLFDVQHKWINRTSMVLLPLLLDWKIANSLSF
jgi:hypothetical protein